MADKSALGKVGLIFGAVTAAVLLLAVVAVKAQTDGPGATAMAPDAAFARSMDTR